MKNLVLLTVMATLLSSVAKTDVVVIPDTPNAGDTTTITTVTTGNPITTDNLISQDFIDGTWNGSMFPDSSDICLLYTSPSPRDGLLSRMPSSA